jgi:hypothetical protein
MLTANRPIDLSGEQTSGKGVYRYRDVETDAGSALNMEGRQGAYELHIPTTLL